jgi:F-type H+-transporting ATPase subunit gamma
VKSTKRILAANQAAGRETTLALVGIKASNGLERTFGDKYMLTVTDAMKKPMSFIGACGITEELLSRPFDQVSLVFNRFQSVTTSLIHESRVKTYDSLLADLERGIADLDTFEFEDDAKLIHLQDLFEFHLACGLYQACLETNTAELGARMSSMDSASKNAAELVGRLSVQYNRGRQAAITTELGEIISGAESVKVKAD